MELFCDQHPGDSVLVKYSPSEKGWNPTDGVWKNNFPSGSGDIFGICSYSWLRYASMPIPGRPSCERPPKFRRPRLNLAISFGLCVGCPGAAWKSLGRAWEKLDDDDSSWVFPLRWKRNPSLMELQIRCASNTYHLLRKKEWGIIVPVWLIGICLKHKIASSTIWSIPQCPNYQPSNSGVSYQTNTYQPCLEYSNKIT